jgi:FKBP-type peptidyl-prolyl cis-trans isomerase SlyD
MNKYIAVSYQLFVLTRGADEEQLQEYRTDEEPFEFITGLNSVLPPFELRLLELSSGETFDFKISPSELYGEYDPSLITDLPINLFYGDDGKPDGRLLIKGNVVPMTDGAGGNYLATVINFDDSKVTLDLNHPHSGTSLHFTGKLLTSRPATTEEIAFAESSRKCGGCGGCGNCGSGSSCDEGCCSGGCGGC